MSEKLNIMESLSDSSTESPEKNALLSDDFYRQLFNLTRVIKLIIDPATLQIIEANSAACEFYGYSLSQLRSMNIRDININALPQAQMQAMSDSIATGTENTFQTQHRKASGEIREVNVQIGYITHADKNYFYSVIQDITERKQLENQLRMITDNMQDMIIHTDAEHCITYTSPSSRILLDYEPEEMVGHFIREFAHPEEADRRVSARQQLIQQGAKNGTAQGRLRHADGHYVDVETVARFMYDDASKYIGGIYVNRDISERKRLEHELHKNDEQLRLISENMLDMMMHIDAQDRILYVSPSSRSLLGYKPEEMIGHLGFEFISPDDLEKLAATGQQVIRQGSRQDVSEFHFRHADGHDVPVETVAHFIYDDDGKHLSSIFVCRDITQRQQLQEMLIEQERIQAVLDNERELSNLKTRMMERIAHEFRTPLTVIQVSSETLTQYYERLTPDKRQQKASTIRSQIQHITDMLDEIGLVVRGSFAPEHLNRVSTDLSKLCREVAADLAIYFNLPDVFVLDVPETMMVLIDPFVFRNALFHIMRNAVRYSHQSAVVSIKLSRSSDGLELNVIDTGIGILSDEQPRIFEPFFRGTNINERSGLGVGLTIAHAAVEAHSGTIMVESEIGKGTTFTLTLPV